jgi:hypothetical protein
VPRDPQLRSALAAHAALTRLAHTDRATIHARAARAREGMLRKLQDEVDPDGTLRVADPADFDRRVRDLRRAKLAVIATKGVKARLAKAVARAEARRQAEAEAELDELLAAGGDAA